MADQKTSNNTYSVSFNIAGNEYGRWLRRVVINKDATKSFVEDYYDFSEDAISLLNMLFAPVTIKFKINQNNVEKPIYKNNFYISKVIYLQEEGLVRVFVESIDKENWFRKNGISFIKEHTTIKDFVQEYITIFDNFYKSKKPTNIFYNYQKNINKTMYENIMVPILNNNFKALKTVVTSMNLFNYPFYMFYDEYYFKNDLINTSLEFYEFSNIKALPAVTMKDLNSREVPTLEGTYPYADSQVKFNYFNIQRLNNKISEYCSLKYKGNLENPNRHKYIWVPDSKSLSNQRLKNIKDFYSKGAMYYRYKIIDIDIRKLQLGSRIVDRNDTTAIQYSQALVKTKIIFLADSFDNMNNLNNFKANCEYTTVAVG